MKTVVGDAAKVGNGAQKFAYAVNRAVVQILLVL